MPAEVQQVRNTQGQVPALSVWLSAVGKVSGIKDPELLCVSGRTWIQRRRLSSRLDSVSHVSEAHLFQSLSHDMKGTILPLTVALCDPQVGTSTVWCSAQVR